MATARSHLRVVEPSKKQMDVSVPPKGTIGFGDFDERIRSPWGRLAALAVLDGARRDSGQHRSQRVRKRLEAICAIEDLLTRHPQPSEDQWAEAIAGHENSKVFKGILHRVREVHPIALPNDRAWKESTFLRHRNRLLEQHRGTWIEPLVQGFSRSLGERQEKYRQKGWRGRQERFKAHTKGNALYEVARFLDWLSARGIRHILELNDDLLDDYLGETPGSMRQYLQRFLRYLKAAGYFTCEFRIENTPWAPDLSRLLGEREENRITVALLETQSRPQECLIGLFVLKFAQTAQKCVTMRLRQVQRNAEGQMLIAFHKLPLTVHPLIADRIDRWLDLRRAMLARRGDTTNPWLFIDPVQPHLPLSAKNLAARIPMAGVSLSRWRTTAIWSAYRNGVRSPGALRDALGIALPTADRYHRLFAGISAGQVQKRRRRNDGK